MRLPLFLKLVAGEPDKFFLPRPSDMRYQWVCARLSEIDEAEMQELIVDAWRMCVPKKVIAEYEAAQEAAHGQG